MQIAVIGGGKIKAEGKTVLSSTIHSVDRKTDNHKWILMHKQGGGLSVFSNSLKLNKRGYYRIV